MLASRGRCPVGAGLFCAAAAVRGGRCATRRKRRAQDWHAAGTPRMQDGGLVLVQDALYGGRSTAFRRKWSRGFSPVPTTPFSRKKGHLGPEGPCWLPAEAGTPARPPPPCRNCTAKTDRKGVTVRRAQDWHAAGTPHLVCLTRLKYGMVGSMGRQLPVVPVVPAGSAVPGSRTRTRTRTRSSG
jgi:hypothetical protein